MTQVSPPLGRCHADRHDAVVVGCPRASDAVGGALRQAFAPDQAASGDWKRCLAALDAIR